MKLTAGERVVWAAAYVDELQKATKNYASFLNQDRICEIAVKLTSERIERLRKVFQHLELGEDRETLASILDADSVTGVPYR